MKTFYQFLEDAYRTAGKTGLYPLGYSGVVGNYPPAYMINTSADAIYYMDQDERLYKGNEGAPFSITHIHSPKSISPPKNHEIPKDVAKKK